MRDSTAGTTETGRASSAAIRARNSSTVLMSTAGGGGDFLQRRSHGCGLRNEVDGFHGHDGLYLSRGRVNLEIESRRKATEGPPMFDVVPEGCGLGVKALSAAKKLQVHPEPLVGRSGQGEGADVVGCIARGRPMKKVRRLVGKLRDFLRRGKQHVELPPRARLVPRAGGGSVPRVSGFTAQHKDSPDEVPLDGRGFVVAAPLGTGDRLQVTHRVYLLALSVAGRPLFRDRSWPLPIPRPLDSPAPRLNSSPRRSGLVHVRG